MKINNDTLKILQNFASINENLVVEAGSELRTVSPTKNILAEATVEDIFPTAFSIADIKKFLATYSYFNSPEINFTDKALSLSNGDNKNVVFYYANPDLLVYPKKRGTFSDCDVEFVLMESDLSHLNKISSLLSCEDLLVTNTPDETRLALMIFDKENPTTDSSLCEVAGRTSLSKTRALFKMPNLKLMPGISYEVTIAKRGIAMFRAIGKDLKYYIALEKDSELD